MKTSKKYVVSLTMFLFICSLALHKAGAAGPKVSELGNKHNLSSLAWSGTNLVANNSLYRADGDTTTTTNLSGKQVCIFCHTPHNANVAGGAPLWNRAFSTQKFSRYSSASLQIRVNLAARTAAEYKGAGELPVALPEWQPDGSSKLCLSCHDGVATNPLGAVLRGGTIAMNSLGGDYIGEKTASLSSFNPATNKMKFGHHPISFVYNGTVAAAINAVKQPTTTYKLPTLAVVKLDKNSKMQCTTCHDAHQSQSRDTECYGGGTCNTIDTRKKTPFWVYGAGADASADQLAVCVTCHPMDAGTVTVPTFTTPWPP